MFLNKGTSQPEASQQQVNGDMAKEWEELVELDDVQLATVVGGGPGLGGLNLGGLTLSPSFTFETDSFGFGIAAVV